MDRSVYHVQLGDNQTWRQMLRKISSFAKNASISAKSGRETQADQPICGPTLLDLLDILDTMSVAKNWVFIVYIHMVAPLD